MAYSPSDFALTKTGPQFIWLDARLTAHGITPTHILDSLKDRVQRFQWKQGWRGAGADGYVGTVTLQRLTANPVVTSPAQENIDLRPWKWTGPIDENGDGRADEVKQPALATFEDAPWFTRGWDKITFRADVDGATTSSNTKYARSELREMTVDGKSLADWSNGDGRVHTLDLSGAFTALPGRTPEAVIAQIHDGSDDVIMVRLEGKRLFVESPYADDVVLRENYTLGDRFDLRIVADATGIWVYFNGIGRRVLSGTRSGLYFKAGCYTQANEDNGTGYGETVLYKLGVTHV